MKLKPSMIRCDKCTYYELAEFGHVCSLHHHMCNGDDGCTFGEVVLQEDVLDGQKCIYDYEIDGGEHVG